MADSAPGDRPDSQPLPLARTPSAAERERVVEQLSQAFAQDLLPLEEFERRVALAYRVESPGDLRALTVDLVAPAPTSGAMTPATSQRIGAVLSNMERRGMQVVPARLEVRAFLANVELDLARARLSSPV